MASETVLVRTPSAIPTAAVTRTPNVAPPREKTAGSKRVLAAKQAAMATATPKPISDALSTRIDLRWRYWPVAIEAAPAAMTAQTRAAGGRTSQPWSQAYL